MRTVATLRLLLLALVLLPAGVGAGWADGRKGHHDHDRARRALEEGRARPLAEILERAGGALGGEIIGVEFEREDGRYVYEFKVIMPDGRLREVYVDAMTAEVLKVEDD